MVAAHRSRDLFDGRLAHAVQRLARRLDLPADRVPPLERSIAEVVGEHLRDARDEEPLRPARALDEQLGEVGADLRGDRGDQRVALRSSARSSQGVHRAHRAIDEQAARAEDVALVELEGHRLEGEPAGAALPRADEHPRRAGLDLDEARLVVARPLGEDEQVVPTGERGGDLVEHLLVGARLLRRIVAAPHDGHGAGLIEQPAQAGDVPERALGDRRDGAGRRRQDEDGIDEPVGVVGDEDSAARASVGQVAGHLHVAEVDAHDAAEEPDEAVAHRARRGGRGGGIGGRAGRRRGGGRGRYQGASIAKTGAAGAASERVPATLRATLRPGAAPALRGARAPAGRCRAAPRSCAPRSSPSCDRGCRRRARSPGSSP